MKSKSLKRWLSVLALSVLCLAVLGSAALAEGGKMTRTEWNDKLLGAQDFLFKHHKDGLGVQSTSCPVYTAPDENSLRLADGKAYCNPSKDIYEAGTVDGWLLVHYTTGKGVSRTGYIAPQYVKKFRSGMSTYGFVNLPAVAAVKMDVTDDAGKDGTPFTTLQEGDSFRILAKHVYKNADKWYIECTVDGKTARGFINRKTASFRPGEGVEDGGGSEPVTLETLGEPSVSPLGTEKAGDVVIIGKKGDQRKFVHENADAKSRWISVAYPASAYPYYSTTTGKDGKLWYYVFVEEDSRWGWITSQVASPKE